MKNNSVRIFIVFILMLIPACKSSQPKNQVCFKQHCIDVEVVTNEEERIRGLQHRQSLGETEGMLFVFPQEAKHAFWMKETYIPLDIIWLDYAKRIVHIEENVKPCRIRPCPTYHPSENALYTLEVNAGYVEKMGWKVGDIAEFHLKAFEQAN